MTLYDQTKKELEDLLHSIRSEKVILVADIEDKKRESLQQTEAAKAELEEKVLWNERLKIGVEQMARERQIGFPWLAEAYKEAFELKDANLIKMLKSKKHAAKKAAQVIKEQSKLRREAEKGKKILEYIVRYYESIAPFLVDLREEVDAPTEEDRKAMKEYSGEEQADLSTQFLSKEEYRKLSTAERNQIALDRFWKRQKSKWLIGRLYERYVGYLWEERGYDVEYVGIFKGYEDLGRDVICKKGDEIVVIQCKNWAKFRTIYEKHIFQFFGTVFQYKDENPDKKVLAIFYTTTNLSPLANRFAAELGIQLEENHVFDRAYPCIKCNISRDRGEKVYHLPFDQQYDNVKIEPERGEFYCATVAEAEEKGFRRAYRWRGEKK